MNEFEQNNAKKQAFLKAMTENLGNITKSCDAVGIKSRTTIFNWRKNDTEFDEAVTNIDEYVLDFVENSLFKQIQEGNTTATIFYLKTKGKARGYIERVDHTTNGKDIQQPVIVNLGRGVKPNGAT